MSTIVIPTAVVGQSVLGAPILGHIVTDDPASTDSFVYPEEIFGKLPTGFVLKKQSIPMLLYWHRKTMEAIDARDPIDDERDFDNHCRLERTISEAVLQAVPSSVAEVASQLTHVVNVMAFHKNDASIEEAIDAEQFKHIAASLARLTAFIRPKKTQGAATKGRKLTRAGLLSRYHSFLLEEIYTIGWHVYGERDYLLQFSPYDGAVECRLRAKDGRHPFFDPAKLTDRATKVLRSVRVDAELKTPAYMTRPVISGGAR
jgi:hypothetical protein